MASTVETAPLPETVVIDGVPIRMGPRAWEGLKLYEKEIATYARELPRLLAEGEEGRSVLVKDDAILSIWDTLGDAIQAGVEEFGLDSIFVQTIRKSDSVRFATMLKLIKELPCP